MDINTEFAQATLAEIVKAGTDAEVNSRLIDQDADDLRDAERRQQRGRPLAKGQRLPADGEIAMLRLQADALRERAMALNALWVARKTAGSK